MRIGGAEFNLHSPPNSIKRMSKDDAKIWFDITDPDDEEEQEEEEETAANTSILEEASMLQDSDNSDDDNQDFQSYSTKSPTNSNRHRRRSSIGVHLPLPNNSAKRRRSSIFSKDDHVIPSTITNDGNSASTSFDLLPNLDTSSSSSSTIELENEGEEKQEDEEQPFSSSTSNSQSSQSQSSQSQSSQDDDNTVELENLAHFIMDHAPSQPAHVPSSPSPAVSVNTRKNSSAVATSEEIQMNLSARFDDATLPSQDEIGIDNEEEDDMEVVEGTQEDENKDEEEMEFDEHDISPADMTSNSIKELMDWSPEDITNAGAATTKEKTTDGDDSSSDANQDTANIEQNGQVMESLSSLSSGLATKLRNRIKQKATNSAKIEVAEEIHDAANANSRSIEVTEESKQEHQTVAVPTTLSEFYTFINFAPMPIKMDISAKEEKQRGGPVNSNELNAKIDPLIFASIWIPYYSPIEDGCKSLKSLIQSNQKYIETQEQQINTTVPPLFNWITTCSLSERDNWSKLFHELSQLEQLSVYGEWLSWRCKIQSQIVSLLTQHDEFLSDDVKYIEKSIEYDQHQDLLILQST